jgi:redox-sensing transcriptional repressor
VDSRANAITVPEGSAFNGADLCRRKSDPSKAPQVFDQYLPFPMHLKVIRYKLPIATTARSEYRTRSIHPFRVRFDNRLKVTFNTPLLRLVKTNIDDLSREDSWDEYSRPVEASNTLTAGNQFFYFETDVGVTDTLLPDLTFIFLIFTIYSGFQSQKPRESYMKPMKLASLPTIKRLPSYLHIVEAAAKEGREFISGTVIAEELELEPIQVRKDLAITGIIGKPRIGFPVEELIEAINSFLQWNRIHNAIIVGAGHLGSALMGYAEFPRHGLRIVGAFDPDPDKIGGTINGVPIYGLDELTAKIKGGEVDLAVLTVPSSHAQNMTDTLVECGIKAIWNFTNVKIKAPEDVIVQKEDLSSGYAVLSVKMRIFQDDRVGAVHPVPRLEIDDPTA